MGGNCRLVKATAYDGDFIVCWFDTEPKEAAVGSAAAISLLPVVETETYPTASDCAGPSGSVVDPRQ